MRRGLAGLSGEDPVAQRLKAVMQQAALKTAAAQMGIAISLNAIPIVGQALSALFSVVTFFTGRQNKKALEAAQAEAKRDIEQHVAQRQREVEEKKQQVADDETPAALALARSGAPLAPPASGLDGELDGWFSDAVDKVKTTVKKVGREIKVAAKTVTGAQGVTDFKEEMGKVVNRSKQQVDLQTNLIKAKVGTREFHDNVRTALAQELRATDPLSQEVVVAAAKSSSTKRALLIGGGVAAVAAIGLVIYLARRKAS